MGRIDPHFEHVDIILPGRNPATFRIIVTSFRFRVSIQKTERDPNLDIVTTIMCALLDMVSLQSIAMGALGVAWTVPIHTLSIERTYIA